LSDKFALIPNRKETVALTRVYSIAQKEITALLLRVDFADYKEIEATKIEKNINIIINRLNRLAIKWAKKTVPVAYTEGYVKSTSILNKIGADKDPFFEMKKHRNSVDNFTDLTAGDFIKANQSIKQNVSIYLTLSRQASAGLRQLQAFDLRDEEIIAGLLDDAIREGASRGKLQQLIRVHFKRKLYEQKFININGRDYNLIKYAKMVSRTRLRQVNSEATKNVCEQYENDLIEISDHGCDCDICQEFEGNVYSISGSTPGYEMMSEWPPYHPNCILPGQRLKAPGGFIAGMSARYNGQAVKITLANGSQVSVTINHMFLTPHGFAPAHLLREGDDIFYCPDFERVIKGNPDKNRKPALIEDIIGSLAKSNSMTARSVPVSPIDFHNDGRFCDGNVNIIGSNSFLKSTAKASGGKKIGNEIFNSSSMTPKPFFSKGTFAEILLRAAHTTDSIMGGFRSPSPVFLARASSRNSVGLADASLGNSDFSQKRINGLISNFKVLGDIAFQSSGLISVDKVLKVDVFDYHGLVYDVHTKTSLYIANGILSSNCEHSASPTSEIALGIREQYA